VGRRAAPVAVAFQPVFTVPTGAWSRTEDWPGRTATSRVCHAEGSRACGSVGGGSVGGGSVGGGSVGGGSVGGGSVGGGSVGGGSVGGGQTFDPRRWVVD
jgi:hypothetical protein